MVTRDLMEVVMVTREHMVVVMVTREHNRHPNSGGLAHTNTNNAICWRIWMHQQQEIVPYRELLIVINPCPLLIM